MIFLNSNESFGIDDIFIGGIDGLLELFDQSLGKLVDQEGRFHVFPGDIEVLLSDGHVLMQAHHIRALVVVGPPEEEGQELHHC